MSGTADAQSITLQKSGVATTKIEPVRNPDDPWHLTAVKSVAATTGSINSKYGVVQSIS